MIKTFDLTEKMVISLKEYEDLFDHKFIKVEIMKE